ncbi:hypothetical protein BS50DRAFT_488596 [Corynespora cassiicola Philippines]|uniref:Regulatory P domain-containing protein n=1 Tax=Corynespora cassiicola Philippines TaxID=1448308 RepID=A0A2T2NWI0_CORCC|nr:hypothetical protein BS50DRAFT_488596 [Corynespora cassiicola Philippines]
MASAKEIPKDPVRAAELYDSGVMHQRIMEKKAAKLAEEESMGVLNSIDGPVYQELPFAQCKDGIAQPFRNLAHARFRCNNVNLHHFLSHTDLGSATGLGSSSWGWVSDDGREFAIIAQGDGAAFAEITNAGKLRYLGRLPQTPGVAPSRWREIRTLNNYIIVGSEEPGHGIQIFDLKKLLDIDYRNGPVTFDPATDLTSYWNDQTYLPLGRSHNVLSNPATNFAYVVGAQPRNASCYGGLIFLDLSDPANPVDKGCAHDDGYVHDAQCLIYKGPSTKYLGREICYGYNEDTLTIYDVTDKEFPETISITSYEGATYAHQGWVLDPENQEFLILDDELDEVESRGPASDGRPVTYIWDIRDLENPKQTGYYKGPRVTIDHNQYVIGNYSYQSNYGAGISVLDISSIPSNPTGSGVREVAWFDVYPEDDDVRGGGVTEFVGTWSSYADYPSGYILINTIERGAWVVKIQNPLP